MGPLRERRDTHIKIPRVAYEKLTGKVGTSAGALGATAVAIWDCMSLGVLLYGVALAFWRRREKRADESGCA